MRNLFETRRMQYTLYNAIGDNPQTWQNGKPVTRADGSPLVTVKLSIPRKRGSQQLLALAFRPDRRTFQFLPSRRVRL